MTSLSSRKEPWLCYITDRKAFAGDESERQQKLLRKIAEAAAAGVDIVQLREKDLSGRELEKLAAAAAETIRCSASPDTVSSTKFLINARVDIALPAGADGVHLPAQDLSPTEVRSVWARSTNTLPLISVAGHTIEDVRGAADARADLVLFAPVFGKQSVPELPAAGLKALHEVCRDLSIPVLALGGVTLANARACREAGAAGLAAIRLFQENDIAGVVRELRY